MTSNQEPVLPNGGTPEEHILITGAAGFIGQELSAALLASSSSIRLTLTDVIEPPIPNTPSGKPSDRVTSVKSDLTSPTAVSSLLATPFRTVYLLHGLMSGGAEANLELGWRVNWDSHRAIIDALRARSDAPVVVFPSSLAVYGPPDSIPDGQQVPTSEATRATPRSSYGAQKLMVETYLCDMSRRGLLDGRVARLPTVIVRPGAPSAAASSFASGIVREPLKGEKSVLPVSRDLEMWVCSPATVVRNLVALRGIHKEKFGPAGRVVNLPGVTVRVQDILDALEAVGRKEALALVEEKPDEKVEAIVGSWPARFDVSWAKSLGLQEDVSLVETVQAFVASLKRS
ncbi:NAD-dependent epimerase/dehydratase [Xylariales sp. PMI_506]|nr:NAD-dependent epimerase/dehydratase [Xylariales sp. PMI_506]